MKLSSGTLRFILLSVFTVSCNVQTVTNIQQRGLSVHKDFSEGCCHVSSIIAPLKIAARFLQQK